MTRPDPTALNLADDKATIAEQLAAARALYMTFDPDSPPWASEGELRRLEAALGQLAADEDGGRRRREEASAKAVPYRPDR